MGTAVGAIISSIIAAMAAVTTGGIAAGSAKAGQRRASKAGEDAAEDEYAAQKEVRGEEKMAQLESLRISSRLSAANAKNLEGFLTYLGEQLEEGKINEEQALNRIQLSISATKGNIKRISSFALSEGIDQLNSQYQDALSQVKFNLEQAREDAKFSEQEEIDRALKEVKILAKEHTRNSQLIKDTMIKRGVVGAPLAAMMAKNNETLGKAVQQVHEVSGKITGEISRNLSKLNAQSLFQQAQLGSQKMQQERALRGDIAMQEMRTEQELGTQQFDKEEAIRREAIANRQELTSGIEALKMQKTSLSQEAAEIAGLVSREEERAEIGKEYDYQISSVQAEIDKLKNLEEKKGGLKSRRLRLEELQKKLSTQKLKKQKALDAVGENIIGE